MRGRTASAALGAHTLLRPGGFDQIRLAWRLLRDQRVASKLKVAVPVLAALYVVSPVDLLPDLLLGLGQIDDLGMIGLAIVFLSRVLPRLAPPDVLAEHMAAMGRAPSSPGDAGDRAPNSIDTTFRVRE